MAYPPDASGPGPQLQDFAPAIEAKAAALDAGVTNLIPPPGQYSTPRLKALAKAAAEACTLLDGKPYTATVPEGSEKARGDVQIPVEVAKHYYAVWQAAQAFTKAHPEDAAGLGRAIPAIETLIGDGEVSLATVALNTWAKSRDFRKFLQEEAPEETPAEQAMDTGPEQAEYDESPHAADLATLFGSSR